MRLRAIGYRLTELDENDGVTEAGDKLVARPFEDEDELPLQLFIGTILHE